jgi:hypothetical protein
LGETEVTDEEIKDLVRTTIQECFSEFLERIRAERPVVYIAEGMKDEGFRRLDLEFERMYSTMSELRSVVMAVRDWNDTGCKYDKAAIDKLQADISYIKPKV